MGRAMGWAVGRSVGRSVGRAVGRSVGLAGGGWLLAVGLRLARQRGRPAAVASGRRGPAAGAAPGAAPGTAPRAGPGAVGGGGALCLDGRAAAAAVVAVGRV